MSMGICGTVADLDSFENVIRVGEGTGRLFCGNVMIRVWWYDDLAISNLFKENPKILSANEGGNPRWISNILVVTFLTIDGW